MTLIRRANQWTTAYSIDFRQQSNQTINNGANSFGGKSWTGVNAANATTFALQQGTGLVIVASTTSTQYLDATRTAPLLRIAISDLVPNYSILNHAVRILVRNTHTANEDFEFARVGVDYNTSPTATYLSYGRGYNAGLRHEYYLTPASTTLSTPSDATFPDEDVVAFEFTPPNRVDIATGVFDTVNNVFPRGLRFRLSKFMVQTTFNIVAQADPYIHLGNVQLNTTGGFNTTFTHLRVDVSQRYP